MRAGRIRPVRFLATVMMAAFIAACGGGDSGTGPDDDDDNPGGGGGGGGATTVTVLMTDNSFGPNNVSVKVGSTVRWQNSGGVAHTSTSATGLWDSGQVGSGGSFSRDFGAAGTFSYECVNHNGMTGTVVVTN